MELVTFLGYCFVSVFYCPCYPEGCQIVSLLGGTALLSWLFQLTRLSALGYLYSACRLTLVLLCDLLPFQFQISISNNKREEDVLVWHVNVFRTEIRNFLRENGSRAHQAGTEWGWGEMLK